MSIISLNFALFSLLALALYYFLPRRPQNAWLLLASYIFYISWDWRFALILAALTVLNYRIGLRLGKEKGTQRMLLWSGIGLNVFFLALFREFSFFINGLRELLGYGVSDAGPDGLWILLPLGISYYVLENISYLVDVYRGQVEAERDLVDFGLYLAYFPKLVAGPIERARAFLPKLKQERVVDQQAISRSLMLIAVGLVRKLMIADLLSAWILQDVYEFPAKYTPTELMIWLVMYAFSIYNDFAGYTQIVRGVSGLFGIELSANFNFPYFSRNFTEFWNRWHISLSHWLRDYIYLPLSRTFLRRNPSRRNLLNLVFPPLVTMLVSGLWHGFSLNMLLWGGLHGMYQVVERIPSLWRPTVPPQNRPLWRQGLAMGVIFLLVILAWVPFRWELPFALEFWKGLTNFSSFAIRYRRMFIAFPMIVFALSLDLVQYRARDEFVFLRWPQLVKAFCLAVILFFLFISSAGVDNDPFIYQGF